MLFNSLDFAVFLPIVFFLYWFVFNKNIKWQNFFVAIASYIFYGWWDWRFLGLIFLSTTIDYFIGIRLDKTYTNRKRKILLWVSIAMNLGLLGFFKYYNFFLDNFESAFSIFGYELNGNSLNIILPVGISFYTFQTLSYTIDVYRKKLSPEKSFVSFAAFVSFFPQLVAGPIERATNLLPQFNKTREFNYEESKIGLRQILWGLVKKIIIADNCAIYANDIFLNYNNYSGSTLFMGAVFFAFQIYGDFSGYSDMAIGTAKLFNFKLMQNFASPYFSRDIAEFWRRWHISLSTWFRDYVYIPLGGSKGSIWMKIRNTFAIFLISGFWHGANWTFIVWGGLNALYFLPLLLLKRNRKNTGAVVAENSILPSIKEFFQITKTFLLAVIAWIFFRSESLSKAFQFLENLFSRSILNQPEFFPLEFAIILLLFCLGEWVGRKNEFAIESLPRFVNQPVRYSFYLILIMILYLFNPVSSVEFIYFQF
ncbi:MAG: MBOAT family O-acyltransferase [Christiangramia sp.]